MRIKKTPDRKWEPAKVVEQHGTPRSYIVTTEDGTAYRRNRRHLMKLSGDTPQPDKEEKTDDHNEGPQLLSTLQGGGGVSANENESLNNIMVTAYQCVK